ncbi:hypothetical protein D9M73_194340 [compost metagenome]
MDRGRSTRPKYRPSPASCRNPVSPRRHPAVPGRRCGAPLPASCPTNCSRRRSSCACGRAHGNGWSHSPWGTARTSSPCRRGGRRIRGHPAARLRQGSRHRSRGHRGPRQPRRRGAAWFSARARCRGGRGSRRTPRRCPAASRSARPGCNRWRWRCPGR